jgi:flagellin
MESILTNYNAMVALQNLEATQTSLSNVQQQISTGLSVNSSKDNAATWAVATTMKASTANLQQVSSNLSSADSTVGVAVSATSSLTDLISQIKSKVTSAQDPGTDPNAVQGDINQLLSQIGTTVNSASLNGINLLQGNSSYNVLATVDTSTDGSSSTPSYINVNHVDLTMGENGGLSMLNGLSVTSAADQVLNGTNPTADQLASGTRQLSYAASGLTSSAAFTVNYTDANGVAQTLSVNPTGLSGTSTTKDLVTALNDDQNFSSLFHATTDSSGNLLIGAANRSDETGSFQIGSVTATGATLTSNNTPETNLTFQDGTSLNQGDGFTFNYSVNGKATSVTLEVSGDKTGTIEAQDAASNSITIALNQTEVSGVSGATLASDVKSALTGTWYEPDGSTSTTTAASYGLAATAAHGTSVGVSANGSTLTISADASAANANGSTDNFTSFTSTGADYQGLLNRVDAADQAVINASTSFGSAQSRVETQKTFIDNLVSSLQSGVGNLIDADMTTESARLSALQVQQQLGTQALSIANQQPQSILALFK